MMMVPGGGALGGDWVMGGINNLTKENPLSSISLYAMRGHSRRWPSVNQEVDLTTSPDNGSTCFDPELRDSEL